MWSVPRCYNQTVEAMSSVDSLVVGNWPDSNDMSTDAEESLLLGAGTKQRLVKTLQAGEDLMCSDL
jgi:hypothetical protein